MDFKTLATPETISTTVTSLTTNGFHSIEVTTKEDALKKIQELIPVGASIMNGASVTLKEIGFLDILKSGSHAWNNLHDGILAETDLGKQALLRKESVLSDFYLGSAHAITKSGEIVIASNTGSQLPHLAFTSPNVIIVVGANKITSTLTEAFRRVEEYIIPLEDVRMKEVYGFGTQWSKTLILHKENQAMGRNVHVIIVKESLGF